MSNLHRLQWIDAMIRAGRYPNGRTIAEHFEISQRQARRDIEYLRDSMGAPLVYAPRENGYCYSDDTYVLPAHLISEDERRALVYLAERYSAMHGELPTRLAGLFARVAGDASTRHGRTVGPAPSLPAYPLEAAEIAAYPILRRACDERRVVTLDYTNAQGEANTRDFCPYKLFPKDEVWYVVGFCRLREEVRVLRLSRIGRVVFGEERFDLVPYYRDEDYGMEAPFHFQTPYTATVRLAGPLDPRALRLPCEKVDEPAAEAGPGAQGAEAAATPDAAPWTGAPIVQTWRITFRSSDEILAALLAQGREFAILHPAWLRERLLGRLARLAELHRR